MSIPFVDCQGLAGAWTLGTVQAGFELVARRSLPGGFGDQSLEANRSLLNGEWGTEVGTSTEWTPSHGVGMVCGTPPCSGFSLLNTSKGKNARGSGSAINTCMRELIEHAAACTGTDGKRGPEFVAFESVQGAFSQGRPWMQQLRDLLEERTGEAYDLTHVKMSGSAVGSAQMRHRYYFVAHRVPFYVEAPQPKHVVTYRDAIGDLEGADFQWEPQPYPKRGAPSPFATKLRADELTCHVTPDGNSAFIRLVDELAPYWEVGEDAQKAVKRYGRKPDAVKDRAYLGPDEPLPLKGWTWPRRINPDKPGYVVTGAGQLEFVHYSENRMLTTRELSRLMGYPDSWDWSFAGSTMKASMLIGKCCPVQSGYWISSHIHSSLVGNVGVNRGDVKQIGDREFLHDSTNIYKPWLAAQRQGQEPLAA